MQHYDKYHDPEKILPLHAASVMVIDNYDRSRNVLVDPIRDKLDEWYKAWRAHVKDDKQGTSIRSNLVIPIIASHVESHAPRLAGIRPKISVWPRGPEDLERARQHRLKIDYDWQHADIPVKIIHFVKQALIYGTAWMKVYHRKQVATRIRRTQGIMSQTAALLGLRDIGLGYRDIEVPTVVWDDPDVECLELDEVYPDPDGKDEDSCSYIIHKVKVDLNHLKNSFRTDGTPLYNQKNVKMLEKLAMGGNPEENDSNDDTLRSRRDSTFGPATEKSIDIHKRRFTLLEQWSDDQIICVIKEFPEVPPLRNERNRWGMKPFLRFTPIPDPNSLLGISTAELLYSIQKELSTLHNARMDHIIQSVHAMMLINRNSGINPRDIRIRPGGNIMVDDVGGDVRYLEPPRLEYASYREDDNLRMWGTEATGAFDPWRGQAGGTSTATESTLLHQSAGSRSSLMFVMLSEQSLKRMARILMRINEAEMTLRMKVPSISADAQQLTENDFEVIDPMVLNSGSNMDLFAKIDVAETQPENKMFRRKELIEGIQAVGGLYQDPNHPVLQRLIGEFLDTYDIPNGQQMASVPVVPQETRQNVINSAVEGASGAQTLAQELSSMLGEDTEGGTTLATS